MSRAWLTELPLFPTAIVGSYVQPDWLIDRGKLASQAPPRVRAQELWRIPAPFRRQAQDDASLLAIGDQERAGLDIIGDGEINRESYSNAFVMALDGIDRERNGTAVDRRGKTSVVPRVVGRIRRTAPIFANDISLLRGATTKPVKFTVPGPFTLSQLSDDSFYDDRAALAADYADAVAAEIKDLAKRGADIVQIDEPYLQARPDAARAYGIAVINRALAQAPCATAVHICFGYGPIDRGFAKPSAYSFLPELDAALADVISIETAQPGLDLGVLRGLPSKTIMLGALDLGTTAIETPDMVRDRIAQAATVVGPGRLWIAPDCGMKYLPRASAYGKLRALTEGARLARLGFT